MREKPDAVIQPATPSYNFILDENLEAAPEGEIEAIEAKLVDHATAAATFAQLADEIAILKRLERQARQVYNNGKDSKWLQLLSLLQDEPEMKRADGAARKLVIFTEHRGTLDYLTDRLNSVHGRPGAVVTIHGGGTSLGQYAEGCRQGKARLRH